MVQAGSTIGSLASSVISVNGGATLDVTGISALTLAQNLAAKGTGTATVNGSVDASGYAVDMQDGHNIGTLNFTDGSQLTLNGTTLKFDLGATASDKITVGDRRRAGVRRDRQSGRLGRHRVAHNRRGRLHADVEHRGRAGNRGLHPQQPHGDGRRQYLRGELSTSPPMAITCTWM